MKISDVVTQLRKIIPQLTDLFSDPLEVVSIEGAGGVVSVRTEAPHGLSTNAYVNITGVKIKTPLKRAVRDGNIIEFQTERATDLTLGWPPHEFTAE